ncbi:MAG: PilZ domain-containing protein [Rhizobiaceae bacterium]|nr:PilZ domain-containing protein [Rhizobiaceae bacterium]MBO6725277.1 PilZ domain-containing protein [Rhizobiaceae bacterium]
MASPAPDLASSRAERRNFQRVPVKLYGRFMLEDRTEHTCQVIDMSPGNVALRSDRLATTGERVIVYLDHVGRVEGVVTRRLPGGFAMTVNASEGKRDKLAAQLTWLANKHELDLPEDRRHERLQPRNPRNVLKLTDGRQYQCRIADLSLSGAGLEIETKPELGTEIMLGSIRGRVVRHFADGVAIEFASLQRLETLEEEFN